jgi:hypothetical protein
MRRPLFPVVGVVVRASNPTSRTSTVRFRVIDLGRVDFRFESAAVPKLASLRLSRACGRSLGAATAVTSLEVCFHDQARMSLDGRERELGCTPDSTQPSPAALALGTGWRGICCVRSRSARRSRGRRQPRCRGTSLSTRAWNARGAVARPTGCWCAGKLALPSSGASSACRTRRGPGPVRRPSARGSGRAVRCPDAGSREAGWGTGSPPASAQPA